MSYSFLKVGNICQQWILNQIQREKQSDDYEKEELSISM